MCVCMAVCKCVCKRRGVFVKVCKNVTKCVQVRVCVAKCKTPSTWQRDLWPGKTCTDNE